MKEENKVLRKVVEQTMKDYYDLQMKFAAFQQNETKRVIPFIPQFKFFMYYWNSVSIKKTKFSVLDVGSTDLSITPNRQKHDSRTEGST